MGPLSKNITIRNLNLTANEINQIAIAENMLFPAKKKKLHVIVKQIKKLKENNVSFDRLYERLIKIDSLGKDSSSKKSILYRYGLVNGLKKFKEKNKKCRITRDYYFKKYGEDEAKRLLKMQGASLENYILRHGEKEGKEKWQKYLEKRKKAYAKKREDGHVYPKYNLDYFINLHGEEKGTYIYNEKIKKQKYKVSKQRYIDEYGEELGNEICRKVKDNTSLSSFIKRYGKEEGLARYSKYLEVQQETYEQKAKRLYPDSWEEKLQEYKNNRINFDINTWIRKYGEKEGRKKYHDTIVKGAKPKRQSVSKISIELFDSIKKVLPDLENYGKKEKVIRCTPDEVKKYARYYIKADCEYNKKIIEFNGDSFHANPNLFEETEKPHPYLPELTSKDIWKMDQDKYEIFTSHGYVVLYVWQSEYQSDKARTLIKCVNFLKT